MLTPEQLDEIRTELQDYDGNGILPNKEHFPDMALNRFYTAEDSNITLTVAHALEVAARAWSREPRRHQLGSSDISFDTAKEFKQEAARLRAKAADDTGTNFEIGASPALVED